MGKREKEGRNDYLRGDTQFQRGIRFVLPRGMAMSSTQTACDENAGTEARGDAERGDEQGIERQGMIKVD